MSDSRPVGFFDSGIGGTCILAAFRSICPAERTVYLADSEHCPYGNRPPEEIIRLSEANTAELLAKGCKMIVVACNTATAAAIDTLRKNHPETPFIGLEPAVKPAALKSKTGIVAVLATAGTFNGRLYNETKAKFAKNVTVIAAVADEFVDEVEKLKGFPVSELGRPERSRLERIVRAKIEPLVAAGADHIVLGCTHFPHLKPLIEEIAGDSVTVVDPSMAVARQARRVLEERGLLAEAT
ncbi:MAG: glutamate racemase [Kiritimatiellae bacterium]|nr:glutamate racemase [Kiritimatiellia bacterium]